MASMSAGWLTENSVMATLELACTDATPGMDQAPQPAPKFKASVPAAASLLELVPVEPLLPLPFVLAFPLLPLPVLASFSLV